MPLKIAIDYDRSGYSLQSNILGALSANAGFLLALLQHGNCDQVAAYAQNTTEGQAFLAQAQPHVRAGTADAFLVHEFDKLKEYDLLYRGDPHISTRAFQRRHVGETAYSVCGITHTICSVAAQRYIAEISTAPLQSWDALVCTSQSALKVVLELGAAQEEYFASRGGKVPPRRFQLPIIPLGVDVAHFAKITADPSRRKTQRISLGISEDAICFFYFGRLSFHAKANPLPMYLALEQAARQTGKTLHLVQAGWFASQRIEQIFRQGAADFCPSVKVTFVDGGRKDVHNFWAAADVFISLSDNIQETFGITPLEAMAAGVPAIVSDWDGYRETVRHGEEGLLVPTYLPAAGAAEELAMRAHTSSDSYDTYVAGISQFTAVDTAATVAACVALIQNPDLRRRLGQAGQQRAKELYDWPRVVEKHVALWEELKQRRLAAGTQLPPDNPRVCFPDPLQIFDHYPTRTLTSDTKFRLTPQGEELARNRGMLERWLTHALVRYVDLPQLFLPTVVVFQLLNVLQGELTAAEFKQLSLGHSAAVTERTLGWLVKANLLEVVPAVR